VTLRKTNGSSRNPKPPVIYAIVAWMILSIIIVTLSLLSGDTADLNSWIEIAIWITSIAGVLSSRKWGCVEVATRAQRAVATTIATTTFPTKGNDGSLVFLKDATVVQNAVAATSATASSIVQADTLCFAKQVNCSFKKQNSNINQCSPLFKHPVWAGRLAWLGRWLYEPKVAGPSPARPTIKLFVPQSI
jgi:hypothetical protein